LDGDGNGYVLGQHGRHDPVLIDGLVVVEKPFHMRIESEWKWRPLRVIVNGGA